MLTALDLYESRMRSYCSKDDPVCCKGHDLNVHLTYFDNYTDDATSWLVSTINNITIPYKESSSSSEPTASDVEGKVSPTTSATQTASRAGGRTIADPSTAILVLLVPLGLYLMA